MIRFCSFLSPVCIFPRLLGTIAAPKPPPSIVKIIRKKERKKGLSIIDQTDL